MSGIVGVLGVQGETPDSSLLQALTKFMAFRGPDAQQTWVGDGVAFGHALLSIAPPSANQQQPLSLDSKVWIVADARLDARADLLSALHNAGHPSPGGAADAELILRAYAAWGQACLDRLLGDFCFAIWDGKRKSLFCAHDQVGIKPFYYAETKRWLVFSNTLDCVRMQAEAAVGLNELSVADFLLFGSLQDPSATIFDGIRRLPPAHALTWCEGKLSVKRYWTPPLDEEVHYQHSTDYEEHFRQLLQTAVKDRLRTDRAAISLSGGLDSTSVAAFARRAGYSGLRAFTRVLDQVMPDDERHYSRLVAESLGIPIEYLTADRYLMAVPPEFPDVQSPQPDENILASFDTDFYKLASNTSRILLTGQGGDVGLFPTNSHFRRLLRSRRFGRFLRDGVQYARVRRGLPPLGVRTLLQRRFGVCDPWRVDYPKWLNPDFEGHWRLQERWKEKSAPETPHPHRPEAIRVLLAPYWQNFLESCDPGATRVCLEQVHPYFDLRLLRFLFSIPPVPWTLDKCLTRSAMRDILPEAVRLRPKAPLVRDPWLIFVRNNRSAFSQAPLNLAAYVDSVRYQAFLKSPAAFEQNSYQFSVRPAVLSAWLNRTAAVRRN
ncbi:MAG: asparagine synthetase B family protein [Terriglobales bacterium]